MQTDCSTEAAQCSSLHIGTVDVDVPFALQTLQIFQFAAQNCGITNVNVEYWKHYLNEVASHKYAVNTLNSIGETISVVNKVLSLVVIIFSYSLSYYIIAESVLIVWVIVGYN